MEPIFLFIGHEEYLLNLEIKQIIEDTGIQPINVLKYGNLKDDYEEFLEELQTVSFFGDKKLLIVSDVASLVTLPDHRQKELARYFKKPNPDVILVVNHFERLVGGSIIETAINNYSYIKEIDKLTQPEVVDIIKKNFQDDLYQIADEAIDELIRRTNSNLTLIMTEIIKIKIYSSAVKNVTAKDVRLLVSEKLEDNIYELVNSITDKNKTKILEIYEDLMANNEDPLRIINSIAGKMIQLLLVKHLINDGDIQKDIAQKLRISSGQAYYAILGAKKVSLTELADSINRLSEVDYKIKSGAIDKKIALELYLLGA